MTPRSLSTIIDYHAHVYFDAASRDRAMAVRAGLEKEFPDAVLGRIHDRAVGPHPKWSYQVAFPINLFGEVVPWLALNRNALTILVHPNTGDDLVDHRDHAFWMGSMPALDLDAFL